MTNYVMVN